jgi:hypothetical protein
VAHAPTSLLCCVEQEVKEVEAEPGQMEAEQAEEQAGEQAAGEEGMEEQQQAEATEQQGEEGMEQPSVSTLLQDEDGASPSNFDQVCGVGACTRAMHAHAHTRHCTALCVPGSATRAHTPPCQPSRAHRPTHPCCLPQFGDDDGGGGVSLMMQSPPGTAASQSNNFGDDAPLLHNTAPFDGEDPCDDMPTANRFESLLSHRTNSASSSRPSRPVSAVIDLRGSRPNSAAIAQVGGGGGGGGGGRAGGRARRRWSPQCEAQASALKGGWFFACF